MTMTLAELVEAEAALTRLLEIKVSAQLAYTLAKLARVVKIDTQHFHQQREALIRELGEPVPDDATGGMRVKADAVPEFLRRMQELGAVETTVSLLPLRLADLPEITGADVLRLGVLVTDA